MKERMMQQIDAVIKALNNVSVNGKENWSNMMGSVAVLEDVLAAMRVCEIGPMTESAPEN